MSSKSSVCNGSVTVPGCDEAAPGLAAMIARAEILAALPGIEGKSTDDTFSPQDVVDELRRRGSTYAESTIRTPERQTTRLRVLQRLHDRGADFSIAARGTQGRPIDAARDCTNPRNIGTNDPGCGATRRPRTVTVCQPVSVWIAATSW
jgi:hypothetical protein